MTDFDAPAASRPELSQTPSLPPGQEGTSHPGPASGTAVRTAAEPRGEQVVAWVLFSTIILGTLLLSTQVVPSEALAPASEASLEASLQQKLADPRFATLIGIASLLFFGLFLAGSVKAMQVLAAESKGRVVYSFAEREQVALKGSRLPYFELISVFLLALILVGGIAGALADRFDTQLPLLLNWLCAGAFAWPLLRGKSPRQIRLALGWHRGEGVLAEIWAGLRAYVTAWPLLACGLVTTALLSRLLAQKPTHPILDWMTDPSFGALAVAASLAVLWAPLCEESVFRGGFYSYLRGRMGKLGAGLLVSLAFAAIHPQGLAGIPFLTSLAFALALTREWRGSIIASVTLHALHNGLAVLGLVLILR